MLLDPSVAGHLRFRSEEQSAINRMHFAIPYALGNLESAMTSRNNSPCKSRRDSVTTFWEPLPSSKGHRLLEARTLRRGQQAPNYDVAVTLPVAEQLL